MGKDFHYTVGLILPGVSSSYQHYLVAQLADGFYQKDYYMLIGVTNDNLEMERYYLDYFQKNTDCIMVISTAGDYEQIADVISGTIPLIFLMNKPKNCPFTCVLESDYSAIYQAVVSSTTAAEQKIACIYSHKNYSSTREALKAYRDACTASSSGFHEDLMYEIDEINSYDYAALLHELAKKNCHAVLSTSPGLSYYLIDCMIFYNSNPENQPIDLFAYSVLENTLSSQYHINMITHPASQFVDLAIQQVIYQIHHDSSSAPVARDFLIKGSLRMHTEGGLHSISE